MLHNRFDGQHRAICTDCDDAYLDFCDEQDDEARLDYLMELEEV